MRRADNPQQQPRYDLYIVTENVGEDAEDGGHLNASYAASDPDTDPASSRRVSASGPEVEERLRVEITDEAVLGNGDLAPTSNTNTKTDKVRLDIDGLLVDPPESRTTDKPKKKVNFSLDQKSILPSLHRAEQRKPRDDSEPRCFAVFRWAVMIMGVLMLLVVVVILGQLVLEFDAKYSKAALSSGQITTPSTISTEDTTTIFQTSKLKV